MNVWLFPILSFLCSCKVGGAWTSPGPNPVAANSQLRQLSSSGRIRKRKSSFRPYLMTELFSTLRHRRNGNDDETSVSTSLSASAAKQDASSDAPKRQPINRSVVAILAGAFLNLLGFTMAGPITPALGKHFGLEIGASFGSLTSAYPLGMLLGLFVWPQLSDKLGRKPIMTASLVGSGIGLATQAYVIRKEYSLAYFLTARALTGAFAGSSPVSKAFLADIGYKTGELPRYLALRDAASTMAFIVGPMLGGILYDMRRRLTGSADVLAGTGSLSFVIGVSAAASLAAGALVGGMVQEVKKRKRKGLIEEGSSSSEDEEEEVLVSCPLGKRMWTGVASVCVVSFLFNIGDSAFHAFFSALLRDGAGMSAGDIGLLYTMLACVSFVVSTTATSRVLKAIGPVASCSAGMSLIGAGLLLLGVAASASVSLVQPQFWILAAAAAIYYCGVPLYGPTIPTMLLQCVPSYQRGAIMGLDGTINTIGRIISPLIMGDVYRRYGAGAAFGLAGIAVFGGVLTAIIRRFLVLRNNYKPA